MNTEHVKATLLEMRKTIHAECDANGVNLQYRQDTKTRLGNFTDVLGEFIDEIPTGHRFRLEAKDGIGMLTDIESQIDSCEAVASKALEAIRDANNNDADLSIEPLTKILAILRGDFYREQVTELVNVDKAIMRAVNAMIEK